MRDIAEILTRFKTELETEILKSPKRGLKQEIRIELGEFKPLITRYKRLWK